jgi:hypothetical protein
VDIDRIDIMFEDWYKQFSGSVKTPDLLSMRLDKMLYTCWRTAAMRAYSAGVEDGKRQGREETRKAYMIDEEPPRKFKKSASGVPSASIAVSETSTASVPVIIEGEITIDRSRPLSDYITSEEGP